MKRILCCLAVLTMLVACGPNRSELVQKIEDCEREMSMVDMAADDTKPHEMIALYRQFVNHFPNDSLAPVYISRIADISINIGKTEQAVDVLDSIIALYPDYGDLAGCQFMKGYAYEIGGQYDMAREAYTEFVETYPDHYLAADMKKMLPYIGLSPEEMFEAIIATATDTNLTAQQ